MSIEQEKLNALNQALGKIEKEFGKGSVMKLGEATSMAIDVISTGSIGLDIAVGIGGLPKGRIIEVYGPESSGKTTGCTSYSSRSAKARWNSSVYRCGTCT